ncbi:MAG: lysylphosphatidylglycerol synthase transmembrane domain-containing protein [Elusimicrobiota bacterium]
MKWIERIILAAGFATLAYLIWKFHPAVVFSQIREFGWKFIFILPLQFCDQSFNSMAWRFAFSPKDGGDIPFHKLFLGRIAGDGVNYLTPSGSVAGEFIRPAILGDVKSDSVKNASVFLGKFSQAIAQMAFILLGILFVVRGRLTFLSSKEQNIAATVSLGMLIFMAFSLRLAVSDSFPLFNKGPWKPMKEGAADYLSRYPGRFIQCVALFIAGYSCGAIEAFFICHFLGMAISPISALAIEVLSNIVDSLFFMVPAKVGTQEAGKTAIFIWLGYPAGKGLAFGLIRHIRELIWAGAGFLVFVWNKKNRSSSLLLRQPSSHPGFKSVLGLY